MMSVHSQQTLSDLLKKGLEELDLSLSLLQQNKLLAYVDLLQKWNRIYNLTAVRDPVQMMTHHILDSLTVMKAFIGAHHVLDVGAGGGLPGIVLAVWAQEVCPDMQISLVDTVHKKTAFLTQVKAELGLENVTVYNARVENLTVPVLFDVITSRAFAELNDFVTWSQHLLAPNGRFLSMKGVLPEGEIQRLPAGWQVTHIQTLHVPNIDVQRHLITVERVHA